MTCVVAPSERARPQDAGAARLDVEGSSQSARGEATATGKGARDGRPPGGWKPDTHGRRLQRAFALSGSFHSDGRHERCVRGERVRLGQDGARELSRGPLGYDFCPARHNRLRRVRGADAQFRPLPGRRRNLHSGAAAASRWSCRRRKKMSSRRRKGSPQGKEIGSPRSHKDGMRQPAAGEQTWRENRQRTCRGDGNACLRKRRNCFCSGRARRRLTMVPRVPWTWIGRRFRTRKALPFTTNLRITRCFCCPRELYRGRIRKRPRTFGNWR